jgi:hypothetical protein
MNGVWYDLEARPKTPFLLRIEIWRHLRGCHLPQTFNVRSITSVVYGFVSFHTYGTIFRASLRKGFPAGPLEESRLMIRDAPPGICAYCGLVTLYDEQERGKVDGQGVYRLDRR